MVVGWYHSHPGFGCWLSGVDVNTQQSFEALNPRAVAVVVDPIQSVKGKVVIDAFRCISPQTMMLGQEPRQTTSNVGHLNKPSIQALIHGLNRHYYSIAINYRKTELEECMLLNLQVRSLAAFFLFPSSFSTVSFFTNVLCCVCEIDWVLDSSLLYIYSICLYSARTAFPNRFLTPLLLFFLQ
jgi:hypothetical protein